MVEKQLEQERERRRENQKENKHTWIQLLAKHFGMHCWQLLCRRGCGWCARCSAATRCICALSRVSRVAAVCREQWHAAGSTMSVTCTAVNCTATLHRPSAIIP